MPGFSHKQAAVNRGRPSAITTLVSFGLALLKAAVWLLTGSISMLASALDSAADGVISFGNMLALRAAARPADREHPFGHGSIEDLAALIQSLLIAASGIFIIGMALRGLMNEEPPLKHAPLGIGAACLSILVAWLLARFLKRAGTHLDSPALMADSTHYATDYLSNLGVLAAFLSSAIFHQTLLDPAISVGIAFLILRTAWDLFSRSAHPLMDRELGRDELATIDRTVRSFQPTVHGYHDLLTRRSGPDRFILIHLDLDADLSFRKAHELSEQVGEAVKQALKKAHVTVHADPWPPDPGGSESHLPYALDSRFQETNEEGPKD